MCRVGSAHLLILTATLWDVNVLLVICGADGMVISHLPHGPMAYYTLYNTIMRHDIPKLGTMSEQYPHLIFHNFTSERGERV